MHPPLDRPHPLCQKEIEEIIRCHQEHPYAKWWGRCNAAKSALDRCFYLEKEEKRKANLEHARAKRARWEETLKER
ncbi:unnamed protein product, partial [Phaeothamnion confervicola]